MNIQFPTFGLASDQTIANGSERVGHFCARASKYLVWTPHPNHIELIIANYSMRVNLIIEAKKKSLKLVVDAWSWIYFIIKK